MRTKLGGFMTTHHSLHDTSLAHMDKTLSDLETAFQNFQNKQEKRWEHFYQQPTTSVENHSGFVSFIKSGDVERKSLTEEGSGRYALPEQVLDYVGKFLKPLSPFRELCNITTIGTDRLDLLRDEGAAESGWVKETDTRDETKTPDLFKVTIPLYELYARPRVSQRLLDDSSIDMQSWLTQAMTSHMASLETLAFVKGDGKTQPKGFLSYPHVDLGKGQTGKIEVLRASSGEDKGMIQDPMKLIELMTSIKSDYLHNATWVMSRGTLMQIYALQDKTGRFLWQPSLKEREPSTLLGYPVVCVDVMPSFISGQEGGIIAFGDFRSFYHIAEHRVMHMMRDPYSSKPYVEFYATRRVGGDVIDFDAVKMLVG